MNEINFVLIIIAAERVSQAYHTIFLIPLSAKCWEVFQHKIFTSIIHKACYNLNVFY